MEINNEAPKGQGWKYYVAFVIAGALILAPQFVTKNVQFGVAFSAAAAVIVYLTARKQPEGQITKLETSLAERNGAYATLEQAKSVVDGQVGNLQSIVNGHAAALEAARAAGEAAGRQTERSDLAPKLNEAEAKMRTADGTIRELRRQIELARGANSLADHRVDLVFVDLAMRREVPMELGEIIPGTTTFVALYNVITGRVGHRTLPICRNIECDGLVMREEEGNEFVACGIQDVDRNFQFDTRVAFDKVVEIGHFQAYFSKDQLKAERQDTRFRDEAVRSREASIAAKKDKVESKDASGPQDGATIVQKSPPRFDEVSGRKSSGPHAAVTTSH